ncbi:MULTISPECIES: hypothetical protein [Cysteiniphilum]|uniref:Uncharacterized protein n=1 Tax=Cysteiniphilum litorale TaxID=2056700 RepID=A0A8J2Z2J5_9GAMM|nr:MULTISPECIES: hypothetical protein [Cysteiniphilum]GGF89665.1 hypothetical protein GCM10010995_03750 [Cysteiniphilum litorale]
MLNTTLQPKSLALGILLSLGAFSYAMSTPQPIDCISANINIDQPDVTAYYKAVKIQFTNHCGKPVNLKNALVQFKANSTVKNVWSTSNFVNSYLNPPSNHNGLVSFTIAKNKDETLNVNQSFSVQFGLNFPLAELAKVSNAQIYGNDTPVSENGKIQFTFKSNAQLQGTSKVTLSRAGEPIRTLNNSNWTADQTSLIDHLDYGDYTLNANKIGNCTAVFSPSNALNINSDNINSLSLSYQCTTPSEQGSIKVSLPPAPLSGIGSDTTVTLTHDGQAQTKALNWNSNYTFQSLSYGDYTLQFQSVSDGKNVANAADQNINISQDQKQVSVTPHYQVSPLVTVITPFTVTSDHETTLELTLKDNNYKTTFNFTRQIPSGNSTQTLELPANDSFTLSVNAASGTASTDKTQFNTSSGTQQNAFNVNIVNQQSNYGKLTYHVGFPVSDYAHSAESIELSDPKFAPLILSNYVAGELLNYMIKTHYPQWSVDKDYIAGSLFAQLLQENISTSNYPGGLFINNETARKQLLNAGQGGPYQLNDYSKRLPSVDVPGSLGLINYTVLQKSLGYSIASQDNGTQTGSTGPETLDNIYFGPLAAAYFHLNDINRIEVNNSTTWGPQAHSWSKCVQALNANQFAYFDMILNAAYNAGTYSDILGTLIDLCAYPQELSQYLPNLANFSLNDSAYINAFQLPTLADGYKPKSLPQWYKGTTFILYPRQVQYYIDQLTNNNKTLAQYGLQVNNSFAFSIAQLQKVFAESMHTLAYGKTASDYQFISIDSANAAFAKSMEQNGLSSGIILNLNNSNDRKEMYQLLNDAFASLEQTLGFKFNATTEENFNQVS